MSEVTSPKPGPLPKQTGAVSVYGLSSEGYFISAKLASKGYEVFIIDEKLGAAMELRPEIAGDYRELSKLLDDEVLMKIKPSRECIADSKVVFFAPKVGRIVNEDVLTEVKSRLAELSKNLREGVLLIFCLPLGISGSKEIVDRIEHASGLTNGRNFFFCYCPTELGRPLVFGCNSPLSEFAQTIEAAGFSTEVFAVEKAEIIHAQRLIARYSSLASNFEAAKRLTQLGYDCPREYKQIYADELSGSICDLRIIAESLSSGDPLLYLVSGSLKSVDGYTRFLVERVREFVRRRELKAARLKILLFSDNDKLEMRGDRIGLANAILERLRDFYSDIEYLNIMKEGFTLPTGMDKTNLMIFLSGSTEQRLLQLYEEQISMTKTHMVRANLPVEFVTE